MKTVKINQRLNFLFFVLLLFIGMICIGQMAFGQSPTQFPAHYFKQTKTTFTVTLDKLDGVEKIYLAHSNSDYDTIVAVDTETQAYVYEYQDGGEEENIDWMFGMLRLRSGEDDLLFLIRRTENGFEFKVGSDIETDENGIVFTKKKP